MLVSYSRQLNMSLQKTIDPYAIHMIEMKSEYWGLKGN